jgi:hypothetical protein
VVQTVLSVCSHHGRTEAVLIHEDVMASVVTDSKNSDVDVLRGCGSATYSTTLQSYKDGSACKTSALFSSDSFSLRLHMYIDDFEVCNPIGSRRSVHKLTAMYYLLGNVDTKYWSQTSNVHLALLARTSLVKQHGLHIIFKPLIRDIQILETEGLTLHFNGALYKLKGSIATVSGDNLASHQIGGFRQSFSSGKCCRYCLADYDKFCDFILKKAASYEQPVCIHGTWNQ